MNECPANDEPLLHAVGVALHQLILPACQLKMLQKLCAAALQSFRFDMVKPSDKLQKFAPGQFLVNERPVGDEAGEGLRPFRFLFDVMPAEKYSARGGFQNSHHHADGGGFARAIGSKKTEHLSPRHLQI